jgi:hypothetical protein
MDIQTNNKTKPARLNQTPWEILPHNLTAKQTLTAVQTTG